MDTDCKSNRLLAPRHSASGFTLIELSVVLVAIGLIVGAILVGRSLIRVAELQSAVKDVNTFKTEINTFRIKYDELPGDAANAATYLGNSVTNGNSNGQIDYLNGAPGEEYNAWNHLSVAHLIAGNFDGGVMSLPASRFDRGLYRISYQTGIYGKSGNMISINSYDSVSGLAHNAILTPVDAQFIDAKIDDGLADSGKVLGFNVAGVPGCVTNDYSSPTGSYILTNKNVLCKMFFVIDY